jgi:hypothetical protein
MNPNDTLHLAQGFLRRFGSGAEAAEIAGLCSENMEWEIAGDTGVLPWIGSAIVASVAGDDNGSPQRQLWVNR